MHYRFRGACLPIEVLERTNSWAPTLADDTPAGSVTLRAERTKLGLVSGRATIGGKPVIYTRLRSTYMHEIDSARGFSDFNDPAKMRDARDFQRAAAKIGYTFNWLYADDRDIAYFNSGDNPQRANGVTGQLPMPARLEWRGFDPDRSTAAYTSFAKHPRAINGQPYMTSWNNKQARGYAGADSNLFSSVFRSQMLDSGDRAAHRRRAPDHARRARRGDGRGGDDRPARRAGAAAGAGGDRDAARPQAGRRGA